jgi:hypothetical protein
MPGRSWAGDFASWDGDSGHPKMGSDGAVMMVPENLLVFVDEVKMTG